MWLGCPAKVRGAFKGETPMPLLWAGRVGSGTAFQAVRSVVGKDSRASAKNDFRMQNERSHSKYKGRRHSCRRKQNAKRKSNVRSTGS
jgi:hypothetical protein